MWKNKTVHLIERTAQFKEGIKNLSKKLQSDLTPEQRKDLLKNS